MPDRRWKGKAGWKTRPPLRRRDKPEALGLRRAAPLFFKARSAVAGEGSGPARGSVCRAKAAKNRRSPRAAASAAAEKQRRALEFLHFQGRRVGKPALRWRRRDKPEALGLRRAAPLFFKARSAVAGEGFGAARGSVCRAKAAKNRRSPRAASAAAEKQRRALEFLHFQGRRVGKPALRCAAEISRRPLDCGEHRRSFSRRGAPWRAKALELREGLYAARKRRRIAAVQGQRRPPPLKSSAVPWSFYISKEVGLENPSSVATSPWRPNGGFSLISRSPSPTRSRLPSLPPRFVKAPGPRAGGVRRSKSPVGSAATPPDHRPTPFPGRSRILLPLR